MASSVSAAVSTRVLEKLSEEALDRRFANQQVVVETAERPSAVHLLQFPASCRNFAPFSGERLITERPANLVGLGEEFLALPQAQDRAAGMPAAACLSRSALIKASFSLSRFFEPQRRVVQHLPLRVVEASSTHPC